jgi:phosphatidylglycerophosphate synthase
LISSTLAAVLLLSSSTLVAILLIVQSELGPKRIQFEAHLSNGLRIAVGVSWLLPILCALCTQLVHNILGKAPLEWWLEWQSFGFTLFVIIDTLFVILFIVLFTTLIKKLLYLAKKHDKYNASILRR